ncbi:MAG: CoA-binding protein [Patescibacteria group bacterium]
MAILVNRDTKVLIQGITGKSGLSACVDLLDYGMKVVGGVTPGKGGQEVLGLPVFDSVKEAVSAVGPIDATMVNVPPLLTLDAALEAIDVGISLVHMFAEKVPVLDTAKILYRARKAGVRVLGPNSVGAISPGEGKIGSIGGPNAKITFSKGPVGVISKSGGMCSELGSMITSAGLGQSTVVGIGGDLLVGTTFVDLLLDFEHDAQTKAVVAFGEVGGSSEIEAAKLVREKKFTKPLIIFLAGKFAESLPKDTALGHAGAIVGLEFSMDEKNKFLKESGVIVAENFEDIPKLIKNAI